MYVKLLTNNFLSEKAVGKSESKDVHLAVLRVLPEVIRESVDAERHADYRKGEGGKGTEGERRDAGRIVAVNQGKRDGSGVDADASSKSVIIYDPATGEKKMVSPTAVDGIESLGEVKTAEQREAEINTHMQDTIQRSKDWLEGNVANPVGMQIQLGDGRIATIDAMHEDGKSAIATLPDGTQFLVPKDVLQRIVNNGQYADYKARRDAEASKREAEQSTESAPETATEGGQPLPEEASPKEEESREYAQGDVFDVVVDGNKMHAEIVSPKDADGRFVVNVDDGESMRTLYVTPEELATMEYKEPKEEPLTESENPRTIDTEEPPISNAAPTEHTPTALERIPRDEKGNAQFHDVDTETAWDGLVEMSGNEETAHKVAEASLANAERKLKAAKALKEKGETPEELLQSIKENEAAAAEAQRTVDAWKAIVGEKARREEAAKAEAERIATEKAEAERKAAEERERAEKEEKARIEAEKKEAERIAAEKAEEEARVEAERKAEEERKAKQKTEEKVDSPKIDKQGNPIDAEGRLITEKVEDISDLSDDDFNNPTRSVELPKIPKNVDDALGANGRPVIIKKNIFEKNGKSHGFTPKQSRKILGDALYNPDIVGQSQPSIKKTHWVAIKVDEKSPITILEVNDGKDNVEVVGWYTLDARNLERIKRQAEREGGELLVLSPKDKVESLPTPTSGLPTDKGSEVGGEKQEAEKKRPVPIAERIEDVGEKIGDARKDVWKEIIARIKNKKQGIEEALKKSSAGKLFSSLFDEKELLESGVSNEVVTFISAVKGSLGTKPRSLSKLKMWINKVLHQYDMCEQALENWESVKKKIDEWKYYSQPFYMYRAAMAVGGYESGRDVGNAELWQIADGYSDGKSVAGQWCVRKAGAYDGIYKTYEEAAEALKKFAGENAAVDGKGKRKEVKLAIYKRRTDGTMFIAPEGKPDVIIQDGFKTLYEASAYKKEHYAEMQERYRTLMDGIKPKFNENRERKGRDWRGGKDVSAEDFREAFDFRGVEFGNWMQQKDRRQALNECYDSLMDLAMVCGVSPKALSLGGKLAMAFGARGGGKFNAHYEPDKVVINLTKTKGAGSLAHEWFHAIDNYFNMQGWDEFATESTRNVERKEMAEAWKDLVRAINGSDYFKRSDKYARLKGSRYWIEPTELGARAFAVWVENRLSKYGTINDYLANNPRLVDEKASDAEKKYAPYPFDKDADWMDEKFGRLFEVMQERVDEETGKHILYSRNKAAGHEKTELTEEERELRDNLVERMRKGGLDVVTDSEEMQRVIDTENERTRNKRSKKSEAARKRDEALYAVDWSTAFVSGKSREEATEIRRERGRKFKEETKELYGRVLSGNFDDVTLRLIDEFIDKSTPNNPYERPISKRLPTRALQKMRGGERTGSVDALFSRICESTVGKDGKTLPRAERERAIEEKKKELLKKWAIATGNWHTDIADFTDQREPIGSGTDSDVYLSKDGKSVIKVSKGKPYGKRFRPDVDNVALFNTVFPGSRYTIEGYGEIDGKFVRFLKQPFVDFSDSTPLTEGERVAYMEKLGFKPINKENTAFSNGEIVASDLQKSNVVRDRNGNVRVIDADMKLHTKDVGGNYSYPDVETDTTGLAEREEVNTGSVREHRVYHGSGADFDAFDHSHMGEGEGAQAYGWGTYVTEVEGIGRTYAEQNATTHNDALRALQHDVDAISDQLDRHRDDLKYDEEQLKRANEWRAEAELDYELFKDEAEELKEKYGESSPEYRNHLFNDIYTDEMKRAQSSVKSTEESIQYRKEKIAELEKALKDKQVEIDELPKEFPRHLYTVEIPDDNGSNYLDWNGHPAESLLKGVGSFLESKGFERVQDSPVRYEKGESTVVLNPNATGADLYAELKEALGSDKKASQALAESGCIGIKYPADNMRGGRKDGAKNYVIFNENDAKITDHTRFLRTADGEVYGLVKDGRIYLDPKVATAETAVHEYTHLWGDMLRRKDSEQWSHTVKELKNSVLWEEVKELYPELKTDDEIADEVLSTFSGRRGAERLREEARRVAEGDGGVFTKAKAIETLERVKEAIARFWEGVARMFGINRYRSAEELADMAMRDLLDSKNPMKDESGMRKRGEVGDEGVRSLKGEEAMVALDNIFEDKKTENMPQKVSSLVKFMELFRKPVRTFLGEVVNVKEEVYNKIIREKRTSISGAVLPTLENADFAIRDTDGSTLYIKRFKSENNDNVYNIAVVNKYGEVEDYVSSVHIKSDNNLRNKITKGAELLLPQERITDGILPRNNPTPTANVTNISEPSKPRFSRKPGESIFDYASRVSEDVDRSVRERVSARDEYEKKVKSKGFQTKEALQNSMLGLQEFMYAIDHASGNKRYIEDIPDFENLILGENRLSSVNKEESHSRLDAVHSPMPTKGVRKPYLRSYTMIYMPLADIFFPRMYQAPDGFMAVRIALMYYVDFYSLFNNPEKEWDIILSKAFDAPSEPSLFD